MTSGAGPGGLPRVLDHEALEARHNRGEPRGRASVVVPAAWLRDGVRFSFKLPTALRCDLCDGGGCDACTRSGAYRVPAGMSELPITLPRSDADRVAIRLAHPFGEALPTLLIVEVSAGAEPTRDLTFVGPNHDAAKEPELPGWVLVVALFVATGLSLLSLRMCH